MRSRPTTPSASAMAAIRMIFVADFVMSLDNMLAVAGASHGSPVKLLMGLFVSIGIIMTCSALIAAADESLPLDRAGGGGNSGAARPER